MFSSSMSAATPTIRRGFPLMPPNCTRSRSVHISRRLRPASTLGNIRCATLWLTMTTLSLSARSCSLKSRPAMIGTPSNAKNPGDTVRKRARGSSSPSALAYPSTENWPPNDPRRASRQGTDDPIETRSTPGSCSTCRMTSW